MFMCHVYQKDTDTPAIEYYARVPTVGDNIYAVVEGLLLHFRVVNVLLNRFYHTDNNNFTAAFVRVVREEI